MHRAQTGAVRNGNNGQVRQNRMSAGVPKKAPRDVLQSLHDSIPDAQTVLFADLRTRQPLVSSEASQAGQTALNALTDAMADGFALADGAGVTATEMLLFDAQHVVAGVRHGDGLTDATCTEVPVAGTWNIPGVLTGLQKASRALDEAV